MPKSVKLKNLAAATKASVAAALGRAVPRRPGTLAGFIVRDAELAKLGVSAKTLAGEVAKDVSVTSGIKVVAAPPVRVPGGILVGYRVPTLMKR